MVKTKMLISKENLVYYISMCNHLKLKLITLYWKSNKSQTSASLSPSEGWIIHDPGKISISPASSIRFYQFHYSNRFSLEHFSHAGTKGMWDLKPSDVIYTSIPSRKHGVRKSYGKMQDLWAWFCGSRACHSSWICLLSIFPYPLPGIKSFLTHKYLVSMFSRQLHIAEHLNSPFIAKPSFNSVFYLTINAPISGVTTFTHQLYV